MKTVRSCWVLALMFPTWSWVGAEPIPTTLEDFHVPGTAIGGIEPGVLSSSTVCRSCHSSSDGTGAAPHSSWSGSLMAMAGRDPLFFAQMTTANQDVANVGYYCMRCHVPMSIVTGHAADADGSSLDEADRDGVSCHFCHAMVDPIYKPGQSPPQDVAILSALPEVPEHFGNAMFVLDPNGLRRGPYTDAEPPHAAVASPFHRSSEMCGTCHDVGNVAVQRQQDGTYWYNPIGQASPDQDPHSQFPLERTYTEWKLSAFAEGGVDLGGRFGGDGATVVSTCQDCHMPRTTARGCTSGPERTDLARHDFAGASAWVLRIIAEHYLDDPAVDQAALAVGQQRAVSMLQRAASLELALEPGGLSVRVVNHSGHKLPTGHIEGRRVFLNVRFLDAAGRLVREHGHYDTATADLDEGSTTVYEMHVGLSAAAAALTGRPAGVTTHMALADTIEKDNRIPPRGFENALFNDAGAPAVGAVYADGQYWSDTLFEVPEGAATAVVTLFYQTVTRHYIEALRDGNETDAWGDILYGLWLATDKGAPIAMASREIRLGAASATSRDLGFWHLMLMPALGASLLLRRRRAELARRRPA